MAVSPHVPESEMLKARAEECRLLGATFRDPELRAKMLRIAVDYDNMALRAESHSLDCSPALMHNKRRP